MIHLTANKRKFSFPQVWGEVTLKQFNQIESMTELKDIASVLSGLQVNDSMLEQLQPFMFFMTTPFDPGDWKLPKSVAINGEQIALDFDIRNETLGQKILLQYNVKPNEIAKAVAIYLQPKITGAKFEYEKAIEVIPIVNNLSLNVAFPIAEFLFSQLRKTIETENKELASSVTSEQVRAGIHSFDQFSFYNTIDSLAGGDVLKYEQVLNLSYNVVFLKLKRTLLESKYKTNYQKIMNTKQ